MVVVEALESLPLISASNTCEPEPWCAEWGKMWKALHKSFGRTTMSTHCCNIGPSRVKLQHRPIKGKAVTEAHLRGKLQQKVG